MLPLSTDPPRRIPLIAAVVTCCVIAGWLTGCEDSVESSRTGAAGSAPNADRPVDFTIWKEVTDGPRVVGSDEINARFITDCRVRSPKEYIAAGEPQFGPHTLWMTRVYANPIAWQTLSGAEPWRFAEGAVLVKQKLKRDESDRPFVRVAEPESESEATPAGVGIMIKREAGYARDDGDWQYAYIESQDKPDLDIAALKKLDSAKNCAACHRTAGQRDHVYMPYLTASK